MNIQEVARITKEKSPYFFSRDTLRFFGQTLKSFKVCTSSKGKVYVYAPSYWSGKLMGYTFNEVVDGNFIKINLVNQTSLEEVLRYIADN